MTSRTRRFFLSLTLLAATSLALVAGPLPGPGGSDQHRSGRVAACEPVIIEDPGIRESFVRFDRAQSGWARRICELHRSSATG